MGLPISKLTCSKFRKKKQWQVNPEALEKKRRRRSSSLRELVRDLNAFWKSSDLKTRKKTLENYFTVASTKGQIEFVHGEKSCDEQLQWLGPDAFEFSSLLGSGGFGAVFRAKRKTTGVEYALKVQPIETMARSARTFGKQVEDETLIHMERTVLASCRDYPFIVSLEYAFYTDIYAVLGLEYVPGGTLSNLISSSPGRCLPFLLCKTYAMELVFALNFMHCKGIIYRDLKPSNVLLALNGHLKLTDFGLAGSMVKRRRASIESFSPPPRQLGADLIAEMSRSGPVEPEPTASTEDVSEISIEDREKEPTRSLKWVRRRTVCGTAGYRPPEQVQERFLDYYSRIGYDERADWFSLGVCCYTMLTGRRPFPTKKELLQSDSQRQLLGNRKLPSKVNDTILEKVLNDAEYQCLMFEVQYPSCFSGEPDAKGFIEVLLSRDPEERPRFDGIISHPWMANEAFEVESILNRPIPEWVKDHAYLQSVKNDTPKRRVDSMIPNLRRRKTLSECIDTMCSECFEKNDSVYAQNFEQKWSTRARKHTLCLFRHWNYMSDEAMKLEMSASNCSPEKKKTDSLSESLSQGRGRSPLAKVCKKFPDLFKSPT